MPADMAMMTRGDPQEPPDDVSSSALAELRRVCPVSSPRPGVHLAVRHADVAAVLADADHFSGASPRSVQGHTPPQALTVQETEGKRHDRLRRIWLGALRRDAIATAEPLVRQVCGDLVASFATVGRADLVAGLAKPAAKEGFAALIGVPEADRERVHRWTVDIRARESAVPAALKVQASAASRAALDAWIVREVDRRRGLHEPPGDILGRLIHATDLDGQTLASTELASQVCFLLRAGTGATVRLIANLLFELARAPERYQLLVDERGLVPIAIDESLRHDPPGAFTTRTCVAATEVGGVHIARGEEVVPSLLSANGDESTFPDAERFQLERGRVPNHLPFGRGRHRCPGAPAARMIATAALEAVLDRIAGIRLAPGFVYQRTDFSAPAPQRLDVEFEPRLRRSGG